MCFIFILLLKRSFHFFSFLWQGLFNFHYFSVVSGLIILTELPFEHQSLSASVFLGSPSRVRVPVSSIRTFLAFRRASVALSLVRHEWQLRSLEAPGLSRGALQVGWPLTFRNFARCTMSLRAYHDVDRLLIAERWLMDLVTRFCDFMADLNSPLFRLTRSVWTRKCDA